MAYPVNLKERILEIAKGLAEAHGISNINVRMVAKEIGISVGTIYNYYPAKGDIVAAVIEDFWKIAFSQIDFAVLQSKAPVDALEYMYCELLDYLTHFKKNWLEQLILLNVAEKQIGRQKEQEYLLKIQGGILAILEKNPESLACYSTEERQKLTLFIYENMMALLRRGEPFDFFKKILQMLL